MIHMKILLIGISFNIKKANSQDIFPLIQMIQDWRGIHCPILFISISLARKIDAGMSILASDKGFSLTKNVVGLNWNSSSRSTSFSIATVDTSVH
jgi:hypothetical protein